MTADFILEAYAAAGLGDHHTCVERPHEGPVFDPFADVDSIELNTIQWRRFLDCPADECIELVTFDARKRVSVAYARTVEDHVRLLREADKGDSTGSYTVFNRIHPGLYARIGEGRWTQYAARASDNDVTAIRAVYLDFDAERPRDISSTDAEKSAAYDAYRACETFLESRLGVQLGRGDSGNGYSLFVPLEPITPSKDTKVRIERFLKAMDRRFSGHGVHVDTSVSNASRLCPAYGTRKCKGTDTPERPHRPTFFSCPGIVERLPIEAIS